MAKFDELWVMSRLFRQLFLINGVFESANNADVGKAEALWYFRYPKVDWGFCDVDGCVVLTPRGQVCSKHLKRGGSFQRWKWAGGELYRFVSKHSKISGSFRMASEYVAYKRFQASKLWGGIPDGYEVFTTDGNPFNLHKNNLILLSKIAMAAIQKKLITISQAIEMDEELEPFMKGLLGRGISKSQWIYDYATIANIIGVRVEKVRQSVSKGRFDPSSLESVIKFCNKYTNMDIEND